MKHASERIHFGFETQKTHHHKSKTELSVASQKGPMSSKKKFTTKFIHVTWDTMGYSWQEGGTHRTGMLSCFLFLTRRSHCTTNLASVTKMFECYEYVKTIYVRHCETSPPGMEVLYQTSVLRVIHKKLKNTLSDGVRSYPKTVFRFAMTEWR